MQENKKKYYRRATYKDEFPMFPQPSAALLFQEIDHFNAIVTQGLHTMSLLKSVPDGLKP
jgi:hypothetical protein